MGAKLKQYYDIVQEKGGMAAKMRLAMKTGVAAAKAETEPDSPELLEKFHAVVTELVGDAPKL
jgi:hypothetical protein